MRGTLLTLILTRTIVAGAGLAQQTEIGQRKENQQDRIAKGVGQGTLSPHETANLERKEAAINRETRRDRARNGGTLTNNQKARVNRQQNRMSRNIYRDKHDVGHQ